MSLLPSWPIVAAAAVAGALLAGGVQQIRVSDRDAQLATLRAGHADAMRALAEENTAVMDRARRAETALADRERALNTTIAQNAEESARVAEIHKTDLAAAAAANSSLREQLATIARAYANRRDAAASNSAAAARLASAESAVVVLADLLDQCSTGARERAAFADAAHAAGNACQRDYDAARAATVSAANSVEIDRIKTGVIPPN